ncbi:MAG: DciA family protein [Burkholderiales bacterium]
MPLHTIGKLLSATDELKALQARTRQLLELQTLYLGSAPRELASSSRVKGYRAGTLFVSAENAAVAAKLKQLTPRILASVQKFEKQVTSIRIEVQVTGRQRTYKSIKTSLTPEAIEEFDALSKRVRDPDLKSALANLVNHHGKAAPP